MAVKFWGKILKLFLEKLQNKASSFNIHYPIHLIVYLSVYLFFLFCSFFFFVVAVVIVLCFLFLLFSSKNHYSHFLSEILVLMFSFYLVKTSAWKSVTLLYSLRHMQLLVKTWFKVDFKLHLLKLMDCKAFCKYIKGFDLSLLACYIRFVFP